MRTAYIYCKLDRLVSVTLLWLFSLWPAGLLSISASRNDLSTARVRSQVLIPGGYAARLPQKRRLAKGQSDAGQGVALVRVCVLG